MVRNHTPHRPQTTPDRSGNPGSQPKEQDKRFSEGGQNRDNQEHHQDTKHKPGTPDSGKSRTGQSSDKGHDGSNPNR